MNVIIVGAGVVGRSLASALSAEDHRVAVIDTDRDVVNDINDSLDVLGIRGRGDLPSTLDNAGIRQCDMVIAVTSEDAVNVMVGMLAHDFGVPHRIVRIRNNEYRQTGIPFERLGIDHLVDPEAVIVDALLHMLQFPGAYEYASLAKDRVQLLGLHVAEDAPVVGVSMADLRASSKRLSFLVCSIARDGEVTVPRGDDKICPGDNVHVLIESGAVARLAPLFGASAPEQRKVVIAGASRIGWHLAQNLGALGKRVVVIESDGDNAERMARSCGNVLVVQGSPQSPSVQIEAGVDHADVFCAVSPDEQLNMTSALLAKQRGARQIAALVDEPEFVNVLEALGVDIVLNPRLTVVGEILQHLRRGHVYSVKRLAEGEAELIDFEVDAGAQIAGKAVQDLRLPRASLVGPIVRDDEVIVPQGKTVIETGDRVLMYALPKAIRKVEALFD